MWDEITYLFPNFNGATVKVWEWINNFHPGPTYNLLLSLFSRFGCLQVGYFKQNYIYKFLSYSLDSKAPREIWNLLRKVVPGKFHGSVGHSKRNGLQDRDNFHMSVTWQIVPILNTVHMYMSWSNAMLCVPFLHLHFTQQNTLSTQCT